MFSNYGQLSNEILLYAYGFAIAGNPADSVAIKLSVAYPPGTSNDRKQSSGEGGVFYIGFGGFSGVPKVGRFK